MDRPRVFGSRRLFEGLALASVVLAAGCRSTGSEVPAARPYARTGDQLPAVGFSSQPRTTPGATMLDSVNVGPGGAIDDQFAAANSSASIYGTPTASDKLPIPTSNQYGAPGSSGLDPTADGGTSALGHALMEPDESTADILKKDAKAQRASAPAQ